MTTPATAPLPQSVDTLVVGGGIIGLSIAYEAAARGRSVLVVERHRCGGGATAVAAGMLAPVSEAEPTLPDMVRFGLESCRLYPDFVARVERDSGLASGYRTEGTIALALHRDHMEELEHRAAEHERLGLRAQRLSGREVLDLEPNLSGRVVGGLRTEVDRQVDPRRLAAALIAAAAARGAVLAEGCEIDAPARHRGKRRFSVQVRRSVDDPFAGVSHQAPILADHVVLCAGAWTRELAPEVADLPLFPVKGQVIRLRGAATLSHVVATPDVYLVPRDSGELVVGASMEEQGFDTRPTAGATMDLLGHAWRALPSTYELEVAEINVGLRPTLTDHLPAIGPIGGDGLLVATGHYRNGILLAPATATYVLDTIEQGVAPDALRPFDPMRFVAGEARASGGSGR